MKVFPETIIIFLHTIFCVHALDFTTIYSIKYISTAFENLQDIVLKNK